MPTKAADLPPDDILGAVMALREEVSALKQATHDVKGVQSSRLAGETMADRIAARLPQAAAVAPASPPLPRGLTIAFAVAAGLVSIAGVVGVVALLFNTYAGFQVQGREVSARLTSAEAWRTEMIALNLPLRMQQLEQNNDTARRIRDQQFQGLADQIGQLRQSDSTAATQNQQLIQQNVQLATRMEDIRRQLDEIRARMDRGAVWVPPTPTPRNYEPEADALWQPPSRGT